MRAHRAGVFTVEERDRIHERILEIAHGEERIVAGAVVGSLAAGEGDQMCIRDSSLGLLVEIPRGESFRGFQDALLAKSSELQLQVNFTPIAKTDLDDWISSQGKDQFIVTILGRAISANHLARVSAIIAEHGLNVDRIERLSGRLSLAVHTPDAVSYTHLPTLPLVSPFPSWVRAST